MMKLGLFVQGYGHHIAAWRAPGAPSRARQNFRHFAEIAQAAEAAKFDLLFSADSWSIFGADDINVWKRTAGALRFEPLTLFSALSAVTERIGLVLTQTTSYFEPYHVARFFASLDQISGGRAGWNLVTSASPSEAWNFSHEAHPPHAERYARAEEFADTVFGLWRTWDENAVVEDRESGLYFEPGRMHFLNHSGPHFSVRGPLTVARSPQGRPVVVEAGQSEAGRALAARTAEVVFTVQQNLDSARAFYADIKSRAEAFGRDPDTIKIMPGVMPVVGATRQEAEDKYAALQELIHPELGVAVLSDLVGIDLSEYPLDGPLPDAPEVEAQRGRQALIYEIARRENLTIRQLYLRVSGARAHRSVRGTATDIADSLEEWYRAGAADGFNVMPLTFPGGLTDFAGGVIPELQRRGLFRRDYEGTTLRDHLGLPIPE